MRLILFIFALLALIISSRPMLAQDAAEVTRLQTLLIENRMCFSPYQEFGGWSCGVIGLVEEDTGSFYFRIFISNFSGEVMMARVPIRFDENRFCFFDGLESPSSMPVTLYDRDDLDYTGPPDDSLGVPVDPTEDFIFERNDDNTCVEFSEVLSPPGESI